MSARATSWGKLFITYGLAATVTAIAAVLTAYLARSPAKDDSCDIAARYLQDETPSPYVDVSARRRVEAAAAARLERCMKE